jgi:MSHA biogenesis protein MshG|tara:strand:+ start:174 stop:1445 length:1272 start_codon:yes stop_codon:yes gene_type:complete
LNPSGIYIWRGRNAGGQVVEGQLEAASEAGVVEQLMAMGVVPIHIAISVVAGSSATSWLAQVISWLVRFNSWVVLVTRKPVVTEDTMLFSRQMYTLSKAGIPIMRGLEALKASTAKPAMLDVLNDIFFSLQQGRKLSTAIGTHPEVFGAFYVAMIKSGEVTGRLPEVFLRMHAYIAFNIEVGGRIKQATRYPMYVMTALTMALVVINIYVLPGFSKVYGGLEEDLPTITRMMLSFSELMVHSWPMLLALLVAGWLVIKGVLRTPEGSYNWDRLKIRLPIVGDIILKSTLARFANGLALSNQSGVPLVQSLTMAADTVGNTFVGERIRKMRKGIERGKSIASCAVATGLFKPIALQMIAVGEETGELNDMLLELAGMYERETDQSIKSMTAAIEPIMVGIIGVMVLLLALGVYLPMWDLGEALN